MALTLEEVLKVYPWKDRVTRDQLMEDLYLSSSGSSISSGDSILMDEHLAKNQPMPTAKDFGIF